MFEIWNLRSEDCQPWGYLQSYESIFSTFCSTSRFNNSFIPCSSSTSSSSSRFRAISDPNESRRLWFDVSQQLNANNVEQATKFKSLLEQKQRDEAKLREKNGVSYNPKVSTSGVHWLSCVFRFSELFIFAVRLVFTILLLFQIVASLRVQFYFIETI